MRKEGPLENVTSKSVVIKRNMGKYDDIINLPHHVSKNHKQMSIYDRSAQFAPFAALVGYGESIESASKKYDQRITLSEDKLIEINGLLYYLSSIINEKPTIEIHYFKSVKGNQGVYVNEVGQLQKIDIYDRYLLINKKKIKLDDIYDISITSKE